MLNREIPSASRDAKLTVRLPRRWTSFFVSVFKNRISFYFLAPYLFFFTLFTIIPVAASIAMSFSYYNILEPPRWIGISNYKLLFLDDDVFLTALANTFKFAIVSGPIGYIMSFLLAWLISQIPQKYRFFYTVCFYTPAITSAIAMSIVWSYLFSGDRYGLINHFMMRIGLFREPWLWLQDVDTILPVLIIVQLWMSMGVGFLAFLAGLANVPRDMYEAGAIDGVRYRWQELWYITIPYVKPQLLFGAVLQVVTALQVFDISVQLVGMPSPLYAGHTVMTHLFDYAFIRFEMGYATAIAVILFGLMVGINRIIFNILGSKGG
ncbi:carbohydrate ABC transporter permease [Paenibacillus chungangensis]|uniref:Carbohydrate ABC transporter permease n=1 Tax=Paenibacillus chungangensis TaxID=696535 RepID=A0ABW3HX09_9BACL